MRTDECTLLFFLMDSTTSIMDIEPLDATGALDVSTGMIDNEGANKVAVPVADAGIFDDLGNSTTEMEIELVTLR